jgi:rRNA maturation RNase YbeY
MINFYSETDFTLPQKTKVSQWISDIIVLEGFEEGEISYVFCDDSYLLELNIKFLDHDTLTDIISFDNCVGKQINGDIYISVERVKENATLYNHTFSDELHRVIIHGILHYCGYKDKTDKEVAIMRNKEETSLSLRSFIK